MRGWRLVAPQRADTAFDGTGASRAGGRWNSRGTRVVYLGGSLALAALELLVHIDYERALQEHIAIPVDFPAELVLNVETSSLPEDWHTSHGLRFTQDLGDAWVRQGASALLVVPSRIINDESNYLLNPKHPEFMHVVIGSPRTFRFDARLLKR